jgi:hypothetical protein
MRLFVVLRDGPDPSGGRLPALRDEERVYIAPEVDKTEDHRWVYTADQEIVGTNVRQVFAYDGPAGTHSFHR